jgi:hypothetical protein
VAGPTEPPHPEELARDQVTVAELVDADRADPTTPDDTDWPAAPLQEDEGGG